MLPSPSALELSTKAEISKEQSAESLNEPPSEESIVEEGVIWSGGEEGGPHSSRDGNNSHSISGEGTSESAAETSAHPSSLKSSSLVYSKTTRSVGMNSYHVTENEEIAENASIRDANYLSDDFASTFMLDEELELEHKMLKRNGPTKRCCTFL